jgi:hypothetical protein
MKTFNLFNEIIVVKRSDLLNAINSNTEFAITYEGDIIYENFGTKPLIYRGIITPELSSTLAPQQPKALGELLGVTYKVVEDDERVLIKAAAAWQDLIGLNINYCDYDDTTADGVAEFSDKALEDMGWHATEFDVKYRTIIDEIESNCDGILFCIEQKEPYQFSGMGFIFDRECAHQRVFNLCQKIIADKIANDEDFTREDLTDDEAQAAEFFKV